jgi:hypothetical protein
MAGQAQALVRITGTVHSSKITTYEGGVNKAGQSYQGGSYGEVVILTEHSRLGGEVSDMPAALTMRVDAGRASEYGRGQVLDALVNPFVDVVKARGQFFNVVGYRFAADVPAPSPAGARSHANGDPAKV